LQFFYTHVLKKTWEDIPLIKPKKARRIPDIVSIEEVNQLFAATRIISYKIFFFVVYTLGLRLSEGINLRVGDIDSSHMRVHIREAKGNKDRLVPLPEKTLSVLRRFWLLHKHPSFIFPSRKRGLKNAHLVDCPIDKAGIQTAMKKVVDHLGFKKNIVPLITPQLCHSFIRSWCRSQGTAKKSWPRQYTHYRKIYSPYQ
jgi:integrase